MQCSHICISTLFTEEKFTIKYSKFNLKKIPKSLRHNIRVFRITTIFIYSI